MAGSENASAKSVEELVAIAEGIGRPPNATPPTRPTPAGRKRKKPPKERERAKTMGKLLVTGATGHLGRLTLQLLLEQVPAERLAGLARDPSRAADLAEQGVEIRQGDYFDY